MAGIETASRRSKGRRPRRAVAAAEPRANRRVERRQAILAAALKEFSARGFAAARLDDIADAAGIAKGTIYLYFRDKETLFQDLILSEMGPVVATLETALAVDLPVRAVAERAVELFVREIYGTSRRDIIRLILSEGPRFPQLADFYYREVLSRIIAAVRALLRRALSAANCAATPSSGSRNCWVPPASSPSSGAACSSGRN